MKNHSLLIATLMGTFLILFSCQFESEQKSADVKSTQQDSIQPILDSLTMELQGILNESIIPGFAVVIVDDKGIVYEKGFGYSSLKDSLAFTSKSINFIASISKTFVGLAIVKLVDQGVLELDEKINDILPYEVVNPHFLDIPITVRHLVTHTVGFTDDFDPEDVGEADILLLEEASSDVDSIQAILDKELAYYKLGVEMSMDEVLRRYLTTDGKWYSENNFEDFEPGTKYSYSNLGAELAARIVEIKSGQPFNEFTERYVFDPLHMNNTGWFYDEVDSTLLSEIYFPNNWDNPVVAIEHPKYYYPAYPSGELKTNVDDIASYLIEMIKGSSGKGKLLGPDAYRLLFEPALDSSYFDEARDTSALSDEYNAGVFWAISSTGLRLHNGGSIGVYSFLYFDPQTKSGAFGFCNMPLPSFGKIRDAVYLTERRVAKMSKRS